MFTLQPMVLFLVYGGPSKEDSCEYQMDPSQEYSFEYKVDPARTVVSIRWSQSGDRYKYNIYHSQKISCALNFQQMNPTDLHVSERS